MLCERCKRETETLEVVPDLATLSLDSLPSVPAREYPRMPALPGVYFAVSDNGVCYIGASKNVERRWRHHPQFTRFLAEPNGRLLWMLLPLSQLRDTEKAAIARFKPLWNKGGEQHMRSKDIHARFPTEGYEHPKGAGYWHKRGYA